MMPSEAPRRPNDLDHFLSDEGAIPSRSWAVALVRWVLHVEAERNTLANRIAERGVEVYELPTGEVTSDPVDAAEQWAARSRTLDDRIKSLETERDAATAAFEKVCEPLVERGGIRVGAEAMATCYEIELRRLDAARERIASLEAERNRLLAAMGKGSGEIENLDEIEQIADSLHTAHRLLSRRRSKHAICNQACYRVEEALELIERWIEKAEEKDIDP